jgi:hypothetical protein
MLPQSETQQRDTTIYPKTPIPLGQMTKGAWEDYYKTDIEQILENIHEFLHNIEAESYVVAPYNIQKLNAALTEALYNSSSNNRKSYRCLR